MESIIERNASGEPLSWPVEHGPRHYWLGRLAVNNPLTIDARQAAGLCGFSGFKSESALRLGKSESKSLAARVAVQATTVSPETLQHAARILQCRHAAVDRVS